MLLSIHIVVRVEAQFMGDHVPTQSTHMQVSFAQSLGYISNDPHVTAVYLNTGTVVEPRKAQ